MAPTAIIHSRQGIQCRVGYSYIWPCLSPEKTFPHKRKKKMTIFGIAMGILTGLSRVRIGAHWLSDVTVSSILTGLLIFAASRLIGAHFVENQSTLRQLSYE